MARLLRKIAGLIEQHGDYLAEIEVRDNGKLISEMQAQLRYMPQWYYYYGGLADKIQGAVVPVDKPDHFTYILREPVGVCAMVIPVELAAAAGRLEAGAGARHRLHGGDQAVGIHLRLAARIHAARDRAGRRARRAWSMS